MWFGHFMWKKENGVLCRKLTPMEDYSIKWRPSMIQLALDIEDPRAIPKCVETLKNVTSSLHLRCDDTKVYQTTKEPPIHKLPEHLTNLEDCIQWTLLYAPVSTTWPMGTISVSSHKVVLNSTHAFLDGHGFVDLINEIMNPTVKGLIDPRPVPMEHVLKKELQSCEPYALDLRDTSFTHFKNVAPKQPDYGDVLELVAYQCPAEQLSCYENGKVKGLTEWISASMILAAKAIHDLGDEFGIQAAVDMRQHLPPEELSWHTSSLSGTIGLRAGHPKTVNELLNRLRSSLNDALKTKQAIKSTKWLIQTEGKETLPHNGLVLYISNVGPIRIKRPVRDLMMRVNQEAPEDASVTASYSVISETANIVKTHTIYGREYATRAQMSEFVKLYSYGLKNLKRSMTIRDAINLLKQQRE